MHAGRIEKSARLQRVHAFLADGRWHSTRDVMVGANVCAVNSCVSELRANGVAIECQQQMVLGARVFYYRLTKPRQEEPGCTS